MMADLLQALHETYAHTYSDAHLRWLAQLYDTIVYEPSNILERALVSTCDALQSLPAPTPASHDAWVADMYLLLAYVRDVYPRSWVVHARQAIHQIALDLRAHLAAEIVSVTGALAQWSDADERRLRIAYQLWTGARPLVQYHHDPRCLAGFRVITHPLHEHRVSYDATLSTRLVRSKILLLRDCPPV